MSLINASHTPPTTASPDTTVFDACQLMVSDRVAAVGVVEDGKLIGLFEELDMPLKVVPRRLDPEKTVLRDVMTTPCPTVALDTPFADALNTMLEKHFRHLAIVDDDKRLLGILSIRSMMQWRIDDLDNAVRGVTSYMGADGIGG